MARSFGIGDATMRNWIHDERNAETRPADPDALCQFERDKLKRLRKDNIELKPDKETSLESLHQTYDGSDP